MALDQRKRQQKVERKKAKRRAKRRELTRHQSQGLAGQFQLAAEKAPILHSAVMAELWEEGIGQVLISRELPNRQVAFVAFLVDIHCMGVKNVILDVAGRDRYQHDFYDKIADRYTWERMKPECARKLVEGAVAYAAQFKIAPHGDYRKARLIFGDIDAAACSREFEYGKDGKPFFVSGPHDSPARCKQIVSMLHASCGPDGYHYLVPIGGPADVELLPEQDWDALE